MWYVKDWPLFRYFEISEKSLSWISDGAVPGNSYSKFYAGDFSSARGWNFFECEGRVYMESTLRHSSVTFCSIHLNISSPQSVASSLSNFLS